MTIEVRPYRDDDRDRVDAIRVEAFRRPMREAWFRAAGYVLTDHQTIQALLLAEPEGQFFGGRSVASAFITSVAVDPLSRGRGAVVTLMRETFRQLRAKGVVFSLLYPSTLGAYRRCGFETAGWWGRYQAPLRETPSRRELNLEPFTEANLAEIMACYTAFARESNGLLDRSERWWRERILAPAPVAPDRPLYRYLHRYHGEVTGYITYRQSPTPGIHSGYTYQVDCGDLIARDPRATRELLGLVAANQPFGVEVVWSGPPEEALVTEFGYSQPLAARVLRWVGRLIDLEGAFAQRGYPGGLTASVEFAVEDSVLPENSRAYRLQVADGVGRLEPIAHARAKIDVAALASIYTGWLPARYVARVGRLAGATAADLTAFDLIFAGPRPWLIELF